MSTVLVTSRSFSSGSLDLVERLARDGLGVVRGPADHDLERLAPALATAVAWIAGTGPVTERHLAAAPALRVIARYGVGYESVDLAAAAARGIVVTNTPGANSDAVADHALALMLAALRGVVAGDRRVRAGDWSVSRGRELGSLCVGLVGFGRIGRAVAARLRGFGSAVAVHDPFVPEVVARDAGVAWEPLEDLPGSCDLVSLHAPGGQLIVDAGFLGRARHGLLVVNTARADLVDEAAVAVALRDGTVAAYAADTLSGESAASPSPLLAEELADRVIITPHLGAQTVEAIDRMGSLAADDVLAVLAGRAPGHPVPREERGS